MLTMGICGDQLPNSMRLREAGVALSFNKDNFTPEETCSEIGQLVHRGEGHFRRNVLRMRRIANTAARRKELAADLMEEVLYDHELRFERASNQPAETMGGSGTEVERPQPVEIDVSSRPKDITRRGRATRPMHLQSADK